MSHEEIDCTVYTHCKEDYYYGFTVRITVRGMFHVSRVVYERMIYKSCTYLGFIGYVWGKLERMWDVRSDEIRTK